MSQLYRKVTPVANPETFTLVEDVDVINNNQNVNVIEYDLTTGSAIVNLPSLTSLFGLSGSGGGATTFRIMGNILAGAPPKYVRFVAYTNGSTDVDLICGDASIDLNGVGTCFELFIAGRHEWGLKSCTPNTFS